MAITITRTPATINSAYRPVIFGVSISDIGTPTVIKKIAYQLFDSNNVAITAQESINAHQVDFTYYIDFQKDLMFLIRTAIPAPNTSIGFKDLNITKQIKLRYYELTLDTINCSVSVSAPTDTALYTIINGVPQLYEIADYNAPGTVLCHLPFHFTQYTQTRRFIWVSGGATGCTVDTRATDSTNYWQALTTDIPAGEVWAVPCHPFGIYINYIIENVVEVRFEVIADNTLLYTYTATIIQEPCESSEGINIMFLDSLGGRNVISMEATETYELSSSFIITDRYRLPYGTPSASDNQTDLTMYGDSILEKDNKDVRSFSFSCDNTDSARQYVKAFLASTGYHLQELNTATNMYEYRKFILNSGSTLYNQSDERLTLTITGYMASPYFTQTIDSF